MILLAVLLFLLALVALVPPFIVLLGQFPGSASAKLEAFISAYSGSIISLGTLFLVSSLALWTTHLSNRSSEKREAGNRRIAAEMKLAEMRKGWINELAADIAEFTSLVGLRAGNEADKKELFLGSRILLRMNQNDPDYDNLRECLKSVSLQIRADEPDLDKLIDLREISQRILKREWERLKRDLREAQLLEAAQ
ncbi:hypothetical protein L0Z66_18185 [Phaeobacter sp. BS34]|uniref:hypothetical protein n=1 Tax=Phaeobacter inhibens TaxID=221822 RepID=UPI000160E618|nr:hypothetical protein [Phaeobacter inhibens]AFO88724.1 hypothetical protein PGA2_c27480 [Phaeobacter inhibens 2.10]